MECAWTRFASKEFCWCEKFNKVIVFNEQTEATAAAFDGKLNLEINFPKRTSRHDRDLLLIHPKRGLENLRRRPKCGKIKDKTFTLDSTRKHTTKVPFRFASLNLPLNWMRSKTTNTFMAGSIFLSAPVAYRRVFLILKKIFWQLYLSFLMWFFFFVKIRRLYLLLYDGKCALVCKKQNSDNWQK